MKEDEVVKEIRKGRVEHAQWFRFDVNAIADDFKAREGQDGALVVSRPPKRTRPGRARP